MTSGREWGAIWSRGAHDWARLIEPQNQPLYDAVHDRLEVGSGTRLLDVGCGPGGAALLAANRGAQVAGLDASPGSVAVARERVPAGDFRVGDMESLPWPDDAFDAVTGFNSFPFAANPAAALAEARRVLAPTGKLGMVVFARPETSQQMKIIAALGALAPPRPADAPGPFALSAPGKLDDALAAAGLRPLERGELPVALTFPSAETASRAFLSGGSGARAIAHSGEERARQALLQVLEEFRVGVDGYRIESRFQFVIAH